MQKTEQLYSDIPPTRLRNRKEKQRVARNLPFWTWLGDRILFRMLSHRFYALRIKNLEAFNERRNKNFPSIIYAPHNNWWDGIVGYNLMRRAFKVRCRMMIEEMNRFPLFSLIGAFPVNKASAQEAMKALKYSVDLLSDLKNILCIFPQGIIRPPHYRPIEFQTGLAYIAQNAAKKYGKVNLIPVAIDFCFFRDNRPEVVVDFGECIEVTNVEADIDRKEYTNFLAAKLTETCDRQFMKISQGQVEDYDFLFKPKLKWYRRIEQRLKRIDMPESGV